MIASKYITRIVALLTAAAVLLCMCAVLFQDRLLEAAGDTGITMDYETELFDTSQVMSVNIIMEQDDWNTMLSNATSEEYYECSVEINGETYHHVAIRPKGNTSLTSIASDPDTERFSLKLEFDHYVEGQTCHGLDKLILNNNYADATNMKEALIYDMYQYMGVDASLYNYASISVNGEYWGVYLALEAVEDSFLLRNYGTQNGDLYKPDSLNIGGAGGDFDLSNVDFSNMDFEDMDFGDVDFSNMTPPDGASSFDASGFDFSDFSGFSGSLPEESDPGSDAAEGTDTGIAENSSAEEADAVSGEASDSSAEAPGAAADASENPENTDNSSGEASADTAPAAQSGETRPDAGSFDFSSISGFGGFSMGGSGADLNYTDDDLDSYSTIWEGAVTDSGNADHKRVVSSLKQVSEGTNLDEVLDVDNLLGYMAVHVFSVNDDSLTGAMAHNYYLYESDGELNIIPWDYNLSLGGMGSTNDATTVINDAIDDAFTGTDFFNTLMEDETYHSEYYAQLRRLVEEYINGGAFDAFYERVRSQIDALVEEDPTAFYSYDEYLEAVDILYDAVKLRGESIEAQLDGSIASYASARSDSDALIDASGLDLSVMGCMDTGNSGGSFGGFGGMTMPGTDRAGDADDEVSTPAEVPDAAGETDGDSSAETGAAVPDTGDFDPSQFSDTDLPEDFDPSQFTGGSLPEDFDPTQAGGMSLPEGFDASGFSGSLPGTGTDAEGG